MTTDHKYYPQVRYNPQTKRWEYTITAKYMDGVEIQSNYLSIPSCRTRDKAVRKARKLADKANAELENRPTEWETI